MSAQVLAANGNELRALSVPLFGPACLIGSQQTSNKYKFASVVRFNLSDRPWLNSSTTRNQAHHISVTFLILIKKIASLLLGISCTHLSADYFWPHKVCRTPRRPGMGHLVRRLNSIRSTALDPTALLSLHPIYMTYLPYDRPLYRLISSKIYVF